MIEQRRTQGWVFTFLGADRDAYAEGEKLGGRRPTGPGGRRPRLA